VKDFKVVHYMQIPLDIAPTNYRKTCFIVYSSRESHINITIDAIETVLESTGKYEAKRLSLHGISGYSQYSQLQDFLNKCSLAIIILDGFRPNVLFEYGILVGLNKPCIVLLEQNAKIDISSLAKAPCKKPPVAYIDMDKDFSDVKDQMYVRYNYTDPQGFRKTLAEELKKIEPEADKAFMKLVFPEKEYFESHVQESLKAFSDIVKEKKLTKDDEIKFRICTKDIENVSNKYGFSLTRDYYAEKIQLLTRLKCYSEAKELIDNQLVGNKSDIEFLIIKSDILKRESKYELGIQVLNEAIKIDYQQEVLWHKKALLLERQDKKVEAEICYKKGIENQDIEDACPTIHFHYGILLLDNNEYETALKQFKEALKIRPTESKYLVCSSICLRNMGDISTAKKTLTEALSFNENNSDAWYQLGVCSEDYTEAIKYFQKCLGIDKKHSGSLCSIGASYTNIGQFENALKFLTEGMKVCDKFDRQGCHNANVNLGTTKYMLSKSGRSEYDGFALEAISDLEKALLNNPDQDEVESVLNSIAYIKLSLNQISSSREYFEKAINISTPASPTKSLILYNLGLTYLVEGNLTKSKELLVESIALSVKMKLDERNYYCLFFPERASKRLALTEVYHADVYDSANSVISLIDSLS